MILHRVMQLTSMAVPGSLQFDQASPSFMYAKSKRIQIFGGMNAKTSPAIWSRPPLPCFPCVMLLLVASPAALKRHGE
jgi:hypothetical protein